MAELEPVTESDEPSLLFDGEYGVGRSSKECGECGRRFAKAAHLLRHARSHAHEKPFSCPTCDKAFARTDALQRHERTVHAVKRLHREEDDSPETLQTNGSAHDVQGSAHTSSLPADSLIAGASLFDGLASDYGVSFPYTQSTAPQAEPPGSLPLPMFSDLLLTSMGVDDFDFNNLLGDWLDPHGGLPHEEHLLGKAPEEGHTSGGSSMLLDNFYEQRMHQRAGDVNLPVNHAGGSHGAQRAHLQQTQSMQTIFFRKS